jgi:hypothetical protein
MKETNDLSEPHYLLRFLWTMLLLAQSKEKSFSQGEVAHRLMAKRDGRIAYKRFRMEV